MWARGSKLRARRRGELLLAVRQVFSFERLHGDGAQGLRTNVADDPGRASVLKCSL